MWPTKNQYLILRLRKQNKIKRFPRFKHYCLLHRNDPPEFWELPIQIDLR